MAIHCKGKTRNGKACGGFAQAGSNYCYSHDPYKSSERRLAQQRGGRNSRVGIKIAFPKCDLNTRKGMTDLMRVLIKSAWESGQASRQARDISRMLQVHSQLYASYEADERRKQNKRDFEELQALQQLRAEHKLKLALPSKTPAHAEREYAVKTEPKIILPRSARAGNMSEG